jgi:hypothetical protein
MDDQSLACQTGSTVHHPPRTYQQVCSNQTSQPGSHVRYPPPYIQQSNINQGQSQDMIDIVVDMTCHPYLSVVALYMYVQSDHYLTEPLSELYMYGQSDHYLAEPLSELNMYASVNFSYILQMTKTSSL